MEIWLISVFRVGGVGGVAYFLDDGEQYVHQNRDDADDDEEFGEGEGFRGENATAETLRALRKTLRDAGLIADCGSTELTEVRLPTLTKRREARGERVCMGASKVDVSRFSSGICERLSSAWGRNTGDLLMYCMECPPVREFWRVAASDLEI